MAYFAYIKIYVSRALGRQVCKVRGHRYSYVYAHDSNCAYECIRCAELDRPFDSLPTSAPNEDGYWPDIDHSDDPPELRAAEDRERRWFAHLPWPKWV